MTYVCFVACGFVSLWNGRRPTSEDFPTASNEFLACIKLREGLAATLASENRFLERNIASTHSDLALCFLMSERAPLVRVYFQVEMRRGCQI